MVISLDDVVNYAPTFLFHPNEKYYPCSIEHILGGNSTLNMQTFRTARQIDGQHTSTPALAYYRDKQVMVYTDAHSSQLWVTTSLNGWNWSNAVQIPGQHTSVPALAVFNDQIFMVYSDANSSQLWWTSSTDGTNWSQAQTIPGQGTSVPAIVAYESYLFMVYTDSNSSQLWQSQATQNPDGSLTWSNTRHIDGQSTSIPAITVFQNKVLMVYSDAHSSQLWLSQYDGNSWTNASQIDGQHTSVPALTVVGDWVVMVYSDAHSSQFWVTRSKDGTNWQDTIQIYKQFGSIPALATVGDVLWMVYTDANSSQLWVTSTVNGDIVPHPPKSNATQTDLQNTALDPGWWIEIAESQYTGQALTDQPPLYYAIQTNNDMARITYVVLYAFQGGQTLRGLYDGGTYFDCKVWDTGTHAGDLERVSVYLIKNGDGSYSFVGVQFEAHGDSYPSKDSFYTRSHLQFDTSDTNPQYTHPVVLVGLNGHGCWNPKDPKIDTDGHRVVLDKSVFAEIGDFFGDPSSPTGPGWWRPWSTSPAASTFKQLGLNSTNQPVSDQVWAAFCGRIGQSRDTDLKNAEHFDDSDLSFVDMTQVKFVWSVANLFGLISDELKHGDGPEGPGLRTDWIYGQLP